MPSDINYRTFTRRHKVSELSYKLLAVLSLLILLIFSVINTAFAVLWLVGDSIYFYHFGINFYSIGSFCLFSFLLVKELTWKRKKLCSKWHNLFAAATSFLWLLIAVVIFYGVFWLDIFKRYDYLSFYVAIVLIINNGYSLIFHVAFCSPIRLCLANLIEEAEREMGEIASRLSA